MKIYPHVTIFNMKTYTKLLAGIVTAALIVTPFVPVFAFSGVLPVAPANVSQVQISMNNYALTVGQTAVVTFTFLSAPTSFITSYITASNGTISNLATTSNPLVYTATFTPNTSVSSTVNTITVNIPLSTRTYSGIGTQPLAIAFDGTNMWTANYNANSVNKVSPTGTITTYAMLVGTGPDNVAFDGTNMWTANANGNSVTEISPTGATTTYSGTGSQPEGIAFDGTNMWTANYSGNSVTEISPTGTTTTYSTGAGTHPAAIAFDGTNMWTANINGNSVTEISPTGATTTYSIGAGTSPTAIAFDGTNMWTANKNGNSVTEISPTGATTTYSGTGSQPEGIAFDGTNMWTANYSGNSVIEISPTGATTTYSTGAGTHPTAIAFDGTNMWTSNGNNSVSKVTFPINAVSSNYTINTVVSAVTQTVTYASGGGGFASPAVTAQVLSSILAPSPATTAYLNSLQQSPLPSCPANWVCVPTLVTSTFTRNLSVGSIGADVRILQTYLNTHGYPIATSGPGSLGNETTTFGDLTKTALALFQKAHDITPATGYFGSITRKIIGN